MSCWYIEEEDNVIVLVCLSVYQQHYQDVDERPRNSWNGTPYKTIGKSIQF